MSPLKGVPPLTSRSSASVIRSRAVQPGADVALENLSRQGGERMLFPKQLAQCGAEPLLGAAAHGVQVLLQQLRLESRHQPLRQLAYQPAALRQPFPLVGIEERKLGGHVGRASRPEGEAGPPCPRV